MRSTLRRLFGATLLVCLVLVMAGCDGETTSGSSGESPSSKPLASADLVTTADVERVLEVDQVKKSEIELNPTAQYQALFESGGKRLLIINVLKSSEWELLRGIGATETIEGLGDKALRSSSYGVVFVKGDRLVAIGSFEGHPGEASTVNDEALLELALLAASRM